MSFLVRRNPYEITKKILCDKHSVNSEFINAKSGPLELGNIKGKCVVTFGKIHEEKFALPNNMMDYEFVFVAFQSNGEKRTRTHSSDDVLVYRTSEVKEKTKHLKKLVQFKDMPDSLNFDDIESLSGKTIL